MKLKSLISLNLKWVTKLILPEETILEESELLHILKNIQDLLTLSILEMLTKILSLPEEVTFSLLEEERNLGSPYQKIKVSIIPL